MNRQNIHQYIHNQLSRTPFLLKNFTQDTQGNKYLPRNIFLTIKKFISDFLAGKETIRIIGMPGLRGVGKTTILAQLFYELYSDYKKELLYISVDEIVNILRSDLYTILDVYQEILGTSFEKLDRNVFIFIDEIQYDKNWPAVLKSIYDKSKKVFIICTGSSALSLQSTTDLSRRIIFEKLYPMSFEEFILLKTKSKYPIKGFKEKIKKILFYSQNAHICFTELKNVQKEINDYWFDIDRMDIIRYLKFDTLPFAVNIEDEYNVFSFINDLIDKFVEKDLFELGKFNMGTIEKIKNILLIVAISDEISITKLSKNLTDISINTLIDIFSALEKAEMIIRIHPYDSAYKRIRKPSKYYFMSPALRHSFINIVEGEMAFEKYKGKYLEDIAALYLHREFGGKLISPIYYDSAKGGADFILKLGDKKIIIEVGFGEKGVRQAAASLEKVKGNYGMIISEGELELIKEKNIVKIPKEYFLLL